MYTKRVNFDWIHRWNVNIYIGGGAAAVVAFYSFHLQKHWSDKDFVTKVLAPATKYIVATLLWLAMKSWLTLWKHKIVWWLGQNIIHLIIYLLRSIHTFILICVHTFEKQNGIEIYFFVVLFATKLLWLDSFHYPYIESMYFLFHKIETFLVSYEKETIHKISIF